MNYRDCRYNTSRVPTFVGYCDLPKYRTETGRRLVECCQEICDDFELKEEEEELINGSDLDLKKEKKIIKNG